MQKISAAIITFNEEKNIARCLESLQGIVDEIVVVDSFSTDKTEDICAQFGVRFVKHRFDGYGSQKNIALSLCSFDYILSLDADEVISPTLRDSFLKFKATDLPMDVYSFNRATHYCGKHVRYARWYPDAQIRLIRKNLAQWSDSTVHEKLEPTDVATRGFLVGDLLHYSYNSFEELINQTNKLSSISAQLKYNKGKRSNLFQILVFTPWRFIRDYFVYRGFLDGYTGFVICSVSAYEVFFKYVKLKQLQDKK